MTNKAFYAFCKEQRKQESDPNKREALAEMYGFMWECGVTKSGVEYYTGRRIFETAHRGQPELVAAFEWLRDVFAGRVTVAAPAPAQETLF